MATQNTHLTPPQSHQGFSLTETPKSDEGRTYAVAGIITSVVGFAMIGLILSVIGLMKSKKNGRKNGLAIFGIALGVVLFILGTIFAIWLLLLAYDSMKGIVERCEELGPGTHKVGNATYECGELETQFRVGI